eukprot:m.44764 g.44764  ORF g.44764 m.44764 type:complete len:421 (+) comp7187_c0_seq3:98-1360(+)
MMFVGSLCGGWMRKMAIVNSNSHNCALRHSLRLYQSSNDVVVSKKNAAALKKKAFINRMKEKGFVDYRRVLVRGGRGGLGCFSFRREPFTRKKYDDGADGGNGGDLIFQADESLSSLDHITSTLVGISGNNGGSNLRLGANAKSKIVKVPLGTIIQSEEGEMLADLSEEGAQFQAALGGAGGRGNTGGLKITRCVAFDDERKQGTPGTERRYLLELKTLADVGLVGMPNAGKSTFASAVSNAHPKIAAYPFTTLNPHLGVIDFADYWRMRIADIPGILPQAHQNRGLGHKFLRHIERNSVMLFIIDASGSDGSCTPCDAFDILYSELKLYKEELVRRPIVVGASKMDKEGANEGVDALRNHLEHSGKKIEVMPLCAESGEGVVELTHRLREIVEAEKEKLKPTTISRKQEDESFASELFQ